MPLKMNFQSLAGHAILFTLWAPYKDEHLKLMGEGEGGSTTARSKTFYLQEKATRKRLMEKSWRG